MTNKTIGEYTETTTPSATDKVLLDIGSGVYKYAQLSKLLSVIPFTTSGKIETTNTSADSIKTAGGISVAGQLITGTKTPASATATGTTGTICWDANYIYVCIATNTWKRVAIATW